MDEQIERQMYDDVDKVEYGKGSISKNPEIHAFLENVRKRIVAVEPDRNKRVEDLDEAIRELKAERSKVSYPLDTRTIDAYFRLRDSIINGKANSRERDYFRSLTNAVSSMIHSLSSIEGEFNAIYQKEPRAAKPARRRQEEEEDDEDEEMEAVTKRLREQYLFSSRRRRRRFPFRRSYRFRSY